MNVDAHGASHWRPHSSRSRTQRLAHNLWLSVAAREMSERQIETLQNDVQALLIVGVAEEGAQQVAAQVGEVQSAVTLRPAGGMNCSELC